MPDNKTDYFSSVNPHIICGEPSIDASDWDDDKLKEYQRIIEKNREEAEKTYDLACKQLNVLLASAGVMLSILVAAILSLDMSEAQVILVISSCFIACSIIISAYASLRSRKIIAGHKYYDPMLTGAKNYKQTTIAGINTTLKIIESHSTISEQKRSLLNCSLLVFAIGIIVMIGGIVFYIIN